MRNINFHTRFAPSPTGPLHLGHAYSACLAHDKARAAGGAFLLRMEDTDTARSRPEWEALIYEDLAWLGLDWPAPVRRQSDHLAEYADVIERLASRGLVYPCSCARSDIRAALSAPQEGAPVTGPDGIVYPGTCRGRAMQTQQPGDALRLNMARALETVGANSPLGFTELGRAHGGTHRIEPDALLSGTGDIVLGRKGIGTAAYMLAVVWDDALQGITHVIRGLDLFEATPVQVLLQRLLGLPTPLYHHHRLIRDEAGKRLAKRDDARAIRTYREDGATPAEVRHMVGL